MRGFDRQLFLTLLIACCAAPALAQEKGPAPPAAAAVVPPESPPSDPVVVAARKPRHRVMRFLFGRDRRRGGFFANLFHPRRGWQATAGHRRHCKRRYRSYDPRTNRYRAYSGVRRICVL